MSLLDLDGRPRAMAGAWAEQGTLLAIGHRDCETTRLTLPYVDRIHRRRGRGAAAGLILQDEPAAARDLLEELGLQLPVWCEPSPYPLATALALTTVPSFVLVDGQGVIRGGSEAFRRADLESYAAQLGVPPPFFGSDDTAPALRPG